MGMPSRCQRKNLQLRTVASGVFRHTRRLSFGALLCANVAAYAAPAADLSLKPIGLQKTQLVKPASAQGLRPPPAQPVAPYLGPAPAQATLVFTATRLRRDYRGRSLGAGSLRFYPLGGRCEKPPRTLVDTQDVTADQPFSLVTIPAERPMVLSSFWSAAGAYCKVRDYNFTPVRGGVYKLTNVQNISAGVCHLRLQRLASDGGHYVDDNDALQPAGRACQAAGLGM